MFCNSVNKGVHELILYNYKINYLIPSIDWFCINLSACYLGSLGMIFHAEMKDKRHKGSTCAMAQPKQEEAFFSIPR